MQNLCCLLYILTLSKVEITAGVLYNLGETNSRDYMAKP